MVDKLDRCARIYLDIETIPATEQSLVEHVAKFITCPGNYKKPESIAKWEAEEKPALVEEAIRKLSFDGAMSHIICIGVALNDEEPISFYTAEPSSEAENLQKFYSYLSERIGDYGLHNIWVGHNITGFDLRMIKQRSIILGVRPPFPIPFDAKAWDKNPYDTMAQWDFKNMTKLEKLALAMGLPFGKGGMDGSQVLDFWKAGKHEEIRSYCMNDVRSVREVHKRMTWGS